LQSNYLYAIDLVAFNGAAGDSPECTGHRERSPSTQIWFKTRALMLRRVSRFWLPLLVLVAVAIGGFVVFRIQGVFGSDNEITREGSGIANDPAPFNPKRVTYEVFGPAGAIATINYLDLSANPQSVKHAPLPWSLTLTTTSRAISPILLAHGSTETIGCRITVDDNVKDEKATEGVDAFTFCQVKSA
jgi:hypothetical protein